MSSVTATTRHLTTTGSGTTALVSHELPDPGPGAVRIRIAAAPVNPVDPSTRDGAFHRANRASGTVGLGWDLAGTVEAAGEGAGGLSAGTPVIAIRDDLAAPIGAHGEAVVLPLRAVGRAPAGIDLAAASTLPLNALTADQALNLLAQPDGATVLITGAAGAVGGFAVQLAKLRGLRVIAQASDSDHDWLREIGADVVAGRDGVPAASVDAALDAASLGAPALAAVRDGGAMVGVLDPFTPPAERGITVQTVHVQAKPGELDELARLAEDGKLALRVAETYPLVEFDAAYTRVEQGGLRGRVILVP
jgi:NADPH:quinone reductase-like Zn-dependent oxidoreductase